MNTLIGNVGLDLKSVVFYANAQYTCRYYEAMDVNCLIKALIDAEGSFVNFFLNYDIYLNEIDANLESLIEWKRGGLVKIFKPKFRKRIKKHGEKGGRLSNKKDTSEVIYQEVKIENNESEYFKNLILEFVDGSQVVFYVEKVIVDLFEKAEEIRAKYNEEVIDNDIFTAALAELIPYDFRIFIKAIGITKNEVKKGLQYSEIKTSKYIPRELRSYIKILNESVDKKHEGTIIGRDEEIKDIFNVIGKMEKRNVLLIGDSGCGKSAVVKKMAYLVKTKQVPKQFQDYIFVVLDVNALNKGVRYVTQATDRFAEIIKFVEKNPNYILCIDNVYTMISIGAGTEGYGFVEQLRTLLESNAARVIGEITNEQYYEVFRYEESLARLFENIEVREPKIGEVADVLTEKIKILSEYHNIDIDKAMIDYIVKIAYHHRFYMTNPDKTKDLVDLAMSNAKNAGKNKVDKESILEGFREELRVFNATSDETKKLTAYHEVGHYIVKKYANLLEDTKVVLVSILPTRDSGGVNYFDYTDVMIGGTTKEFFLQYIAVRLAGYVGEKKYSNQITAGASCDINDATTMAHKVITEYGLIDKESRKALLNYKGITMINDRVIDEINNDVDQLFIAAEKIAEKIIDEHMEEFERIVKAVLKEGILSEEELNEL